MTRRDLRLCWRASLSLPLQELLEALLAKLGLLLAEGVLDVISRATLGMLIGPGQQVLR
jgi:hypothetical protein